MLQKIYLFRVAERKDEKNRRYTHCYDPIHVPKVAKGGSIQGGKNCKRDKIRIYVLLENRKWRVTSRFSVSNSPRSN
jgi:hypothetical protein